jgi:hypothetical protein
MDWNAVAPIMLAVLALIWAGSERVVRGRELASLAKANNGKYIEGLAAATLDIVTASQEELRDLRRRVRYLERSIVNYRCVKCDTPMPTFILQEEEE